MLDDPATIERLARMASVSLLAMLLGALRAIGLFLTFPLITRLELPQTLATPVAFAMSLPVAMSLYAPIEAMGELEIGLFLVIALKELAIGALMGILLGVPFFAASAAGDLIDQYRGASAPNIFDPVNAAEVTTLGSLLGVLSIALFVVAGGFVATTGLLYQSHEMWPVLDATPRIAFDAARGLGEALTGILRLAFLLAAPPLVTLVIIDVLFVFIERSARRFNVFELATTVKNLATLSLAPVYAAFFAYYLQGEWRTLLTGAKRFLGG